QMRRRGAATASASRTCASGSRRWIRSTRASTCSGSPSAFAFSSRCPRSRRAARRPTRKDLRLRRPSRGRRFRRRRPPPAPRPRSPKPRARSSAMPAETRLLRVMIVDDESPARSLLREYLAAEPDVQLAGECTNGFEAVKAIGELSPDLVLLDVQMPKLDGFEVLELLERPPAVVFVTAYDEYALKAFEVHAVDYVLKPVSRERLAEALAHARARLADDPKVPATPSALSLAAAARAPGQFLERILVKDGARVHVIPVQRLDWIEAQDDYAAIHAEGKMHLKPRPLAEVAAGLDPGRFVRIHRSYVLNIERLARIEPYAKDSRVAILHDGRQLPLSRAGYARLRELL